jgi:pimeloyl-ACP methyl ester carboxylesterase
VIGQGIPDARFVIVEDAAHIAPVEQPELVRDLITDHLDDMERT